MGNILLFLLLTALLLARFAENPRFVRTFKHDPQESLCALCPPPAPSYTPRLPQCLCSCLGGTAAACMMHVVTEVSAMQGASQCCF